MLDRPKNYHKYPRYSIQNKVDQLWHEAQDRYNLSVYNPPKVIFVYSYKPYGATAWFDCIAINLRYFLYNEQFYYKNILYHEIAHCIVFCRYGWVNDNHGKEWKEVLKWLGVECKKELYYDDRKKKFYI